MEDELSFSSLDDSHIDCFDGLRLMYEGKDVEGQVLPTFVAPKEAIFKQIIFELDGKKYRFQVEEV